MRILIDVEDGSTSLKIMPISSFLVDSSMKFCAILKFIMFQITMMILEYIFGVTFVLTKHLMLPK